MTSPSFEEALAEDPKYAMSLALEAGSKGIEIHFRDPKGRESYRSRCYAARRREAARSRRYREPWDDDYNCSPWDKVRFVYIDPYILWIGAPSAANAGILRVVGIAPLCGECGSEMVSRDSDDQLLWTCPGCGGIHDAA